MIVTPLAASGPPLPFYLVMGFIFSAAVVSGIRTLIDKRKRVQRVQAVVSCKFPSTRVSRGTPYRYAGFRLSDGREIKFRMTVDQYLATTEGEHGILSYQGRIYLDFQNEAYTEAT